MAELVRRSTGVVRHLVGVAAAAVVLVACGGDGEAAIAGYEREPAPQVGDVVVVDHAGDPDGSPFPVRAEPGGLLVLYVGFLSCPDVCPLTMSDLAEAYDELPAAERERLTTAMVTIDPGRDEGDEIAGYLSVFFDDHRALRAPDDETLAELVERLGVTYRIEEHEPGDDQYGIEHSAVTYVVDDDGEVIWELPFGVEPDEIADALDRLLARADVR